VKMEASLVGEYKQMILGYSSVAPEQFVAVA
jgi:hypothetical protein